MRPLIAGIVHTLSAYLAGQVVDSRGRRAGRWQSFLQRFGHQGDGMPQRQAYGYLSLPRHRRPETETRLRLSLAEFAVSEELNLRSTFVDERDEPAAGFAALRELLRRRADARVVVLPSLAHVGHIEVVARLTHAGLARYLNVAVLLTAPAEDEASVSPILRARRPASGC